MKTNHSSFTLKVSGLLLDPSNPFIGASPDGIIGCTVVVESFERAEQQSFFLEEDDHGNLHLKENHPYYSQVQLQMKLYGASYCDFIAWRQNEMFIRRIPFNVIFISEAL